MRFTRAVRVCAGVLLFLIATRAHAQVSSSGSISGLVRDASGDAAPGTSIAAINQDNHQQWDATTDARGRYRFLSLPLGHYRLTARLAGFAPADRDVTLSLGDALDVPFTLRLERLAETVTVSATAGVVDLSRTHTAVMIAPSEIEALPLNGRNYLDLALLAPGVSRTNTGTSQRFAETSAVPGTGISVSSQRNLNNSFVVDGLSANDDAAALAGTYFSEEVIREFQVVTSGGSAEFGRASAGTINVVTRSGGDRFTGRGYGFFRNGRLDARNALATGKDPLDQEQYGFTLGGPLRRESTFFFGNVEAMRQHRTAFVTIAPASSVAIDSVLRAADYHGGPATTGPFDTGFTALNLFGRVDRRVSDATRLAVRYSFYDVESPNARSVGGLNAISRGTALNDRDNAVAFSLTNTSASFLHELRAQFVRSVLDAPPNDLVGPAVTISGVASFGTSTVSPTGRLSHVYQVADTITVQRGPHVAKAGADLLVNDLSIDFPGALQGAYTFGSLASFAAGQYVTFQQAFGSERQDQFNPNVGLFVQDEWRARNDLSVVGGLRYDLQDVAQPIATDANNVSPRLGIAWAPGNRRTVVRANAGIYFDRIPLRAVSNALQRDGVKYRVAVLSFGQEGAPVFPARLDGFPSNVLTSITTMDPHIDAASSRQASVQIERTVRGVVLSAGYQHLTGRQLIMSRNVNVPTLSAADAARLGVPNLGRPNPAYANIGRFESIGRSQSNAFTATAQTRVKRVLEFRVAYTLSSALDDAGNFFFSQPQDASNVHADWGPSDNDQRHRLSISGSWTAPAHDRFLRGWQVAWLANAASELPFNVVTGVDDNFDTNVNDRPAGVGRNSGRAWTTWTIDMRLARGWQVRGARIEGLVEAFNVLNHPNYALPNNVFGTASTPRPTFGRPTAAGDPRQFQIGVRVSFQ